MTTTTSSASRQRRAEPAPVRFSSPDGGRRGRSPASSPPAAPAEFVSSLDDRFLSCRGDRHSFPKLLAKAGRLPRGISVTRQHDGCFAITFTCPDCGTERTRVTLRGGRYDPSAVFTYRYPPGYLAPADSGLRRSDYSTELVRRVFEGGFFQ